VNAVNAVVTL